ncbi:MAG: RidA family protein [Cyanobacteria bacterium HKST-UBA06]|nr:RidA family protein [Cyanobacteria bacterium HKST-UBA04]MCA9808322.1 RidA family protein [Cyanobacteria bacterium HKST-UBA06]
MGNVVTINLREFEMSLPQPPEPVGSYVSVVQVDNLVYTSGMLPIKDGELTTKGKVGVDCSIEDAQEAARLCTLNAMAAIKKHIGGLAHIERIVKVTGYVNAPPEFTQHPTVINGASDLLAKAFGANGKHVRAAVGVASLPLNAAVEIDFVVQVEVDEEEDEHLEIV